MVLCHYPILHLFNFVVVDPSNLLKDMGTLRNTYNFGGVDKGDNLLRLLEGHHKSMKFTMSIFF